MPTDPDVHRLLKAMRRIARAMDVHSSRIHREVGLTLPQMIVLTCIRDLGEVTSRAISAEAGLSPPTVVGILDKLADKGLIERYRSQADRRVVHTRLTTAGIATLHSAPPLLGEHLVSGWQRLSDGDRVSLLRACERVAEMQEPEPQPGEGLADGPRRGEAGR